MGIDMGFRGTAWRIGVWDLLMGVNIREGGEV